MLIGTVFNEGYLMSIEKTSTPYALTLPTQCQLHFQCARNNQTSRLRIYPATDPIFSFI